MRRNRPLFALRSAIAILKDPNELPLAFELIGSLPGRSRERMLAKLQASGAAERLLAADAPIRARLNDRAALEALPPASLGRTYAELTKETGISADGIVDASAVAPQWAADSHELRVVEERLRDTHDLWHVAVGYGVDPIGELGLLSFVLAQTSHPGIALLLAFVYARAFVGGMPEILDVIRDGYRRGSKAAYLPAVVWEDLLDRPLVEVRSGLSLDAPPVYTPLTTEDLRARGLLPATA